MCCKKGYRNTTSIAKVTTMLDRKIGLTRRLIDPAGPCVARPSFFNSLALPAYFNSISAPLRACTMVLFSKCHVG